MCGPVNQLIWDLTISTSNFDDKSQFFPQLFAYYD